MWLLTTVDVWLGWNKPRGVGGKRSHSAGTRPVAVDTRDSGDITGGVRRACRCRQLASYRLTQSDIPLINGWSDWKKPRDYIERELKKVGRICLAFVNRDGG
ncbi:uncharacterized protein PgNI_00710 [Pyricularia grisea]|uniref:Uncharacterized protein n=1 Tax=Pyricularia grisea TaxID=148305 RepID=A0A6P8BGQ2_PYRGI|nr:uncharacterized protein PgNI_00710 [Pyricularia grisea]TLD15895.1 hypothetical protein PgNI_00710 [Pyricularia grisea]